MIAQRLANRPVDHTGLGRRRVAAGADRPDLLVGDYHARQIALGHLVKSVLKLAEHDPGGFAAIMLLLGFPDAEYRRHAMTEGGQDLPIDQLVALAEDMPAL